MTAIVANRAADDLISEADHNTLALALKAIGITDDNDGDPMAGRAFGLPISLRGGDANLAARAVGPSSSYTVPAGALFVVTQYQHAAGVTDTVTPSGGGAITLSSYGTAGARSVMMVLGAGDQIAMGAGSACMGQLLTAAADVTRVLQTVTNAVTYSVAAGKVLHLTHASPVAAVAGATTKLTIDGVTGPVLPNAGEANTASFASPLRLALRATQVLASSTADTWLISGVVVNA